MRTGECVGQRKADPTTLSVISGETFPEAEVSPGHVQGEARPGAAEEGGGV